MTTPTYIWGRGTLEAAAMSADGATLVVATSLGVIVLDPNTLETRRVIPCERQLKRISISDDGERITAWSGKNYLKRLPEVTRAWASATGEPLDRQMPRPDPTPTSWAVSSPDQRHQATAGERGTIQIGHGEDATPIDCGARAFYCVGFNTKGALVVVQRGSITLFDASTGDVSLRQPWPKTWIESLCVSADGLVTAMCTIGESTAEQRVVLSLRDGQQVGPARQQTKGDTPHEKITREYPELFEAGGPLARVDAGRVDAPQGPLSALNASATQTMSAKGGRIAVVVNSRIVRIHDAASGAVVTSLEAAAPVRKVALDDTGSLLVAALELGGHPNATIQMWDTTTNEQLAHGTVHGWIVADMAFTPGGELLVTCSYDRTICFWTPRPMKLLAEYVGHAGEIHAVAVHPNGEFLVSGGTDGSICWWTCASLRAAPSGRSEAPRRELDE